MELPVAADNEWRSHDIVSKKEMELYDTISQKGLNGPWFSERRALTLDVLAALTAFLDMADVQGPVLDVGCNAGYMTKWLAAYSGREVTGMDFSKASIALARKQAGKLRNLDFVGADVRKPFGSQYEMIVCSRGFPDDKSEDVVFENIANALLPGGFCVLSGVLYAGWGYDALAKIAKNHELDLVLVDELGGLSGIGEEYAELVVLMKDEFRPFSSRLIEKREPSAGFRRYMASRRVPVEEKTVIYYRCQKAAGKLRSLA